MASDFQALDLEISASTALIELPRKSERAMSIEPEGLSSVEKERRLLLRLQGKARHCLSVLPMEGVPLSVDKSRSLEAQELDSSAMTVVGLTGGLDLQLLILLATGPGLWTLLMEVMMAGDRVELEGIRVTMVPLGIPVVQAELRGEWLMSCRSAETVLDCREWIEPLFRLMCVVD